MTDELTAEQDEIVAFLEGAGLERHVQTFLGARIDMKIARKLSEADLRELNMPIGDRHRYFDALAAAEPAAATQQTGSVSVEAQRRQLTVVFSDIVDSTRLLQSLDPEDYRDVLRLYRDLLNRIVMRYNATILHFAGDGVIVGFGFPRAYEDDARRAISAALEIAEQVSNITVPGANEELCVRVGIATGICVVGDLVSHGTAERDSVVGDAVNLAARLQGNARTNGVVICPVTRHIAGRHFHLEEIGPVSAKGFAEPVVCWHVLGAAPSGAPAPSPTIDALIGYDGLVRKLDAYRKAAKSGALQAVVLSGQPGAGKSRLIADLRQTVAGESATVILWRGSQLFSNTALHAVVEWVRIELGLGYGPLSDADLQALEAFAADSGLAPQMRTALLAELISGTMQSAESLDISAAERRQNLLSIFIEHLRRRAQDGPVLLVIEDLHWIDPTTHELAGLIRNALADEPIFLVMTTRDYPDEEDLPGVQRIAIPRLKPEAAARLVRQTANPVQLSDAIVASIVARSEGVPLYLVEITRLLANAQRTGAHAIAIPVTLQGALTARLDALGDDREVALVCSVLGREFQYDLLPDLLGRAGDALDATIERLVQDRILEQRALTHRKTFRFTHALIHEAAYESLLKRQRADLHKSVIKIFDTLRPDLSDSEPELLAYHYSNASDHAAAAEAWHRASENALRKSAHSEAVSHINNGITAIENLRPGPARTSAELKLYSAKGRTLISLEGHASPNVYEALHRAEVIAGTKTVPADMFPVIWGLNAFHMIRGEVDANERASARLVDIAEAGDNHEHHIVAYTSRCLALYYAGQFEAALDSLRKMEKIYDPRTDPSFAYKYAVDRLVVGYQHGTWLLWLLGRADEAAAMERQMNAHVRAHPHPYSFAQALTSGASVYVLRREPHLMLERAQAGVDFALASGKKIWVDHGDFWIGWALSEMGQPEKGGAMIEKALDRYVSDRTGSSLPKFYAMLAENRLALSRVDEAAACIRKARDRIKSHGEQCYLAECKRIEAAILRQSGAASSEVETVLETTLLLAREQQALGWELRITRDLAEVLMDRGEHAKAHDLLADLLPRIVQGHETPDYLEAQALLDASA